MAICPAMGSSPRWASASSPPTTRCAASARRRAAASLPRRHPRTVETLVTLPDDSYTRLAPDLRMCRVLNGLWQVSGAHGAIDRQAAIPSMVTYHDAGFTTWDLADHYGPAEDFVGAFRRLLAADRGAPALDQVQ